MLLGLLFSVVIQGVLSQSNSTFYGCDFIESFADCDRFISESYCGTNFVTYDNRCEFSKAHCKDPSIDLLHVGPCTDVEVANAKPVAGNEVIMDFFCTSLSHTDCPSEEQKVCASDGRTYINYCEFEKAKCTHRNLTVVLFGDCPHQGN